LEVLTIDSIISLFVLGVSVGTFGTLVGIGGGIILIPIFLLIFQWTPQQAVGTSLVVVFLNALSGTIAYVKQKKVYYDAAIRFSIATLPGAVIGSYLADYFTSTSFKVSFGGLLMIVSLIMFFLRKKQEEKSKFGEEGFTYHRTLGVLLSTLVGFLSSILGIGGGVIHVPAMVYILGFPTHVATATSHFVLAVSTFVGVVTHYIIGNILVKPALMIGIGAVVGAQIGAQLSLQVKSNSILVLLSIALFILGLRLVFTA